MRLAWLLDLPALVVCVICPRPSLGQGLWIPVPNGSAEDGEASPDGTTVVPVPHWTTTGTFTVVTYGTPGPFLDPSDYSGGGSQFFCGGQDSLSAATQTAPIPEEGLLCSMRK